MFPIFYIFLWFKKLSDKNYILKQYYRINPVFYKKLILLKLFIHCLELDFEEIFSTFSLLLLQNNFSLELLLFIFLLTFKLNPIFGLNDREQCKYNNI